MSTSDTHAAHIVATGTLVSIGYEGKTVDDLVARHRADRGMHVYHYAAYEVTALKRLTAAHGIGTEELDDLLRSLLVFDPAGRVEGLRLPAHDLANEAFRGLPLRPGDFDSRIALLSALRGQMAEIAIGDEAGDVLKMSIMPVVTED